MIVLFLYVDKFKSVGVTFFGNIVNLVSSLYIIVCTPSVVIKTVPNMLPEYAFFNPPSCHIVHETHNLLPAPTITYTLQPNTANLIQSYERKGKHV